MIAHVAAGAAGLRRDPDRRHRAGGQPVARGAARWCGSAIPEDSPRVSIHVPSYNEPPQMVIETLNALARLDYDNFEVIVLDNNTPDPASLAAGRSALRASLGARFRFFHFDKLQGLQGRRAEPGAGADRSRRARYIAVIDSDYQVEPFWLRRAMPYFASPEHRAGAGAAGLSRRRGKASSRRWPMRNIAASSISAWSSATSTTPSSSTAP